MFWDSKEKIFETWVIMGCGYMCENDRVYDNIVSQNAPKIDSNSQEFIAGKFLFRSFGVHFATSGAAIQKKLDESTFLALQELLKMIMIAGTNGLNEKSKNLAKLKDQAGYQISELPMPELLVGGTGAEFMSKNLNAFVKYCGGQENASEELVDLYLQALAYPIKDLDRDSLTISAMGMFAGARKSVMQNT